MVVYGELHVPGHLEEGVAVPPVSVVCRFEVNSRIEAFGDDPDPTGRVFVAKGRSDFFIWCVDPWRAWGPPEDVEKLLTVLRSP